jgi:hypothetical protein
MSALLFIALAVVIAYITVCIIWAKYECKLIAEVINGLAEND